MATTWEFETVMDGMTIRYNRCSHCAALPTEQQIKDLLAIVNRDIGYPCVICDRKAKISALILYHSKDEKMDRWSSQLSDTESLLDLSGYSGETGQHVSFKVHTACAAKALPGAGIQTFRPERALEA